MTMKLHRMLLVLLPVLIVFGCGRPEQVKTKKVPKEFVEFGHTRIDDYFWLNNPSDSAVIQHLREENAYTQAMMKHTDSLQGKIYGELIGRIEQKYESLP